MTSITPTNATQPGPSGSRPPGAAPKTIKLKLYVAGATPNSVRAEHNLHTAIKSIAAEVMTFELQVIDVFTQQKRAILDNVIVTPTLIMEKGDRRHTLVGDLSETARLHAMLLA
ncbi:circadian clock KaiB family protein [Mesorhizobium sp. ES1-1]|uniref:circadian clock KaiB family protein n=1 Tax=Mesorhizobium sp. ES1-1 TaxID=2876629 RepID=UPI001CCD824C|nr:circadian clock KaiB family protein [Mesorhizobium sp. ES1-1]MBZ9675186.1 circadian clock KaiB family protein [Mesorhizobium sp. ES1-1]